MRTLLSHKRLHSWWKSVRSSLRALPIWVLSTISIFTLLAVVWFCTPLPTITARYVWEHYHAGSLALFLDRQDARLALGIGDYYFGNQLIATATEHPYNLPFAKKAYGKTIAIDPSVGPAHYMRARIEFIQASFDEALTDLNIELELHPANKRILYMRGLVYAYRGQDGDLLRAENDFISFIVWAPTEWAGYNDLAFVLAKEKKYAEAAKVLKEGISKADEGTTNAWFWNALGVMELNLNKPTEAVSSLIKAQTYASSLTEVNWQRAYPGNNPVGAQAGVETMKASIARNLLKAYSAIEK